MKYSEALPETNFNALYVIVADDAFAMTDEALWLYWTYYKKRIFNYRLSRARHVVDNNLFAYFLDTNCSFTTKSGDH